GRVSRHHAVRARRELLGGLVRRRARPEAAMKARWSGLAIYAALALVGPFVPGAQDTVAEPLAAPSAHHWLGATGMGQDVLRALVAGAPTTLGVATAAGAASVFIGASVGATAGYLSTLGPWLRRVAGVLRLATEVALVLPSLPLAILLA